jgi:N-acetylneuraminic acid mutarotase
MRIGLLIGLLATFSPAFTQQWQQTADFPGVERDDGCSFTIGNTAYCGTGIVPFVPRADFHAFDLLAEIWTTIASLPAGEKRQYASGFASDTFGFVFGGVNDTAFLNDLWRYDPKQDQWKEMSGLPSFARAGAAVFVIDSIAYILGGKNDSLEATAEVWAYHMFRGSWKRKQDLPFGARWRASAAGNDSLGYLAFGLDDSLHFRKEVYEYNPLTDSWKKISDFPGGGRNYVKMQLMGDQLITIGGMDSAGVFSNACHSYNLSKQQWKTLPPIPATARRAGICFKSSSAIYYTTGLLADYSRTQETWRLEDPTNLSESCIKNAIGIYPNPATDHLYLSGLPTGTLNFEVWDQFGRQVMRLESPQLSLSINLLNAGIYHLIIRQNESAVYQKLTFIKL